MANFNLFIPLIQQAEGGYQAHPNDEGNYNSLGELVGTNFGISARLYEGIIRRPPTVADMKAITKAEALNIFRVYFWEANGLENLYSQKIAEIIGDLAINSGNGAAGVLVQQVLNNNFGYSLAVDGAIGPKTRAAINSTPEAKFYNKVREARVERYYNIVEERPDQAVFLEGWLNRIERHFPPMDESTLDPPQSSYIAPAMFLALDNWPAILFVVLAAFFLLYRYKIKIS